MFLFISVLKWFIILANSPFLQFLIPISLFSQSRFSSLLKDMVAFSCCEYDFVEAEKLEMDMARERGWKGKFRRRGRVIRPGANRIDGKCPLTPLEVSRKICFFPQYF